MGLVRGMRLAGGRLDGRSGGGRNDAHCPIRGPGPDERASDDMDGWEIALLATAGYVAVTTLVRLMLRRRDQMVEQLRGQAEQRTAGKRRAARKRSAVDRQQAA